MSVKMYRINNIKISAATGLIKTNALIVPESGKYYKHQQRSSGGFMIITRKPLSIMKPKNASLRYFYTIILCAENSYIVDTLPNGHPAGLVISTLLLLVAT
jgi:hypothetical protein